MGKHKPGIYDPSTDCGDYVVCTNCKDLHVTGKKMQQKLYYRHTTRPGSLKSMSMEKMMEKWGGGEVLKRAVRGMLPKNRLRDDRMGRLKCKCRITSSECLLQRFLARYANAAAALTGFEGPSHPYKANILRVGEKRSIARPFEELQAMSRQITTTSIPTDTVSPASQ